MVPPAVAAQEREGVTGGRTSIWWVAMDRVARQVFILGRRRRMAPRRGPLAWSAAMVTLAAVALSGCGGGATIGASGPSTTTRGHSTASTRASSSRSGEAAAVLAAYRAASTAFQQALATANPQDPTLATTMVNPQLQGVKANLLADQRQGIVGRGTVTLHPKLVGVSATTATVVDCVYSSSMLVYEATGKPVPPITRPEHDGVRAMLVLVGGSWRLAKQSVTEGKCAAGS